MKLEKVAITKNCKSLIISGVAKSIYANIQVKYNLVCNIHLLLAKL